jgi:hypothetical protein
VCSLPCDVILWSYQVCVLLRQVFDIVEICGMLSCFPRKRRRHSDCGIMLREPCYALTCNRNRRSLAAANPVVAGDGGEL